MPSLGLSNKAIYENDNSEQVKLKEKEFYPEESHFILTNLQGRVSNTWNTKLNVYNK